MFKFDQKLLKTLHTTNSLNVNLFKIKLFFKLAKLFIKNIFYSKKNYKELNNVEIDYNNIWSGSNYFPSSVSKKNTYLEYKNRYYISSNWEERIFFYNILCTIIKKNKINSVLEVGCGNGVLSLLSS